MRRGEETENAKMSFLFFPLGSNEKSGKQEKKGRNCSHIRFTSHEQASQTH